MNLKPCPFCGSDQVELEETDCCGNCVNIGCFNPECKVNPYTDCRQWDNDNEYHKAVEEVEKIWNTRTEGE